MAAHLEEAHRTPVEKHWSRPFLGSPTFEKGSAKFGDKSIIPYKMTNHVKINNLGGRKVNQNQLFGLRTIKFKKPV